MRKKFSGDSCKNARIKINYEGKEPKVTFSYPKIKEQKQYSAFPLIIYGWIILLVLLYVVGIVYSDMSIEIKKITSKNNEGVRYSSCIEHYSVNYDRITKNTCDLYAVNQSSRYFYWNLLELERLESPVNYFGFLMILIIIFLPPLLIYFPFRKFWMRIYPKYQAWEQGTFKSYYCVTFKPKDFEKDKNYLEIPMFHNRRLNYKATKEFSKYLINFEIKEHPFKRLVRWKGKIKKRVNEEYWYARFYFSQQPKTGKVEVEFK